MITINYNHFLVFINDKAASSLNEYESKQFVINFIKKARDISRADMANHSCDAVLKVVNTPRILKRTCDELELNEYEIVKMSELFEI